MSQHALHTNRIICRKKASSANTNPKIWGEKEVKFYPLSGAIKSEYFWPPFFCLVLEIMMYMKKAMGTICNTVQKLEHVFLYV